MSHPNIQPELHRIVQALAQTGNKLAAADALKAAKRLLSSIFADVAAGHPINLVSGTRVRPSVKVIQRRTAHTDHFAAYPGGVDFAVRISNGNRHSHILVKLLSLPSTSGAKSVVVAHIDDPRAISEIVELSDFFHARGVPVVVLTSKPAELLTVARSVSLAGRAVGWAPEDVAGGTLNHQIFMTTASDRLYRLYHDSELNSRNIPSTMRDREIAFLFDFLETVGGQEPQFWMQPMAMLESASSPQHVASTPLAKTLLRQERGPLHLCIREVPIEYDNPYPIPPPGKALP